MVRIENDYKTNPNNAYFWNVVTRNIIRSFGITDRGTEFFDSTELTIPYSNRQLLILNLIVDKAGTYLFNNNQRSVRSLYAPSSGTFEVEIPLIPSVLNEIKAIDVDTEEISNVINVIPKELYGYIVGAVGLEMFNIFSDLLTYRNFVDCRDATIEVLERFYGASIQAKKQSSEIETIEEFRNLICRYLKSIALQERIEALRIAAAGMFNVISIHLSIDHFIEEDNSPVESRGPQFITDGSTWILDRDNNGILSIDSVVRGNLEPGVYQYIVVGINNARKKTHIATTTIDVRHWGSPSTIVLEWEDVGSFQYNIYRNNSDGITVALGKTRDTKYFDVGQDLDELDILENSEIVDLLNTRTIMNIQLGKNAHVRDAGYQTESPYIIYIEMEEEPTEYQKAIFKNIYDAIVGSHLQYDLHYIIN